MHYFLFKHPFKSKTAVKGTELYRIGLKIEFKCGTKILRKILNP